MSKYEMTQDNFNEDVKDHKLEVICDQGVCRTLKCSKGGSFHYGFYVTTWPGYLCISGDMGSWVFSRLPDMFEFFRGDKINVDYWAEKLQNGANGHRQSGMEFDRDVFVEGILSRYTFEDKDEHRRELECLEFDHEIADYAISHMDMDGCDLPESKEFVPQLIWCMYAIQWAIKQYNAAKGE